MAAEVRQLLVFRLTAVMAGFGAPAVGEQRPVWTAPSKSGALGLVAAALGLRRDAAAAHQALHAALGFAVRADRVGSPMRDFHTAQAPAGVDGAATRQLELHAPGQGFVLSDRRYVVDVAYTLALWARAPCPWPLEEIAGALRRPRFALYLGRRSCPLGAPPQPRLITAETLLSALEAYDALNAAGGPSGATGATQIWADGPSDGFVGDLCDLRTRRDDLYDRSHWLFRDRLEGRLATPDGGAAL
jgi:CRISPR system Cascade subunit CasD